MHEIQPMYPMHYYICWHTLYTLLETKSTREKYLPIVVSISMMVVGPNIYSAHINNGVIYLLPLFHSSLQLFEKQSVVVANRFDVAKQIYPDSTDLKTSSTRMPTVWASEYSTVRVYRTDTGTTGYSCTSKFSVLVQLYFFFLFFQLLNLESTVYRY